MSDKRTTKVVVVLFLPALGGRNALDGLPANSGNWGWYTSSTPIDSGNGYVLGFTINRSGLNEGASGSFVSGFSIRCVR